MSVFASSVSLWTSGIFAGIALSISYVIQPAILLDLPDDKSATMDTRKVSRALNQWVFHFDRAAPLQVSLCLISCLSSLSLIPISSQWKYFAVSAALMGGGVFVYTMVALMPVNFRLKALAREEELSESEAKESILLLNKWGSLHAVRTAASLVAFTAALRGSFLP